MLVQCLAIVTTIREVSSILDIRSVPVLTMLLLFLEVTILVVVPSTVVEAVAAAVVAVAINPQKKNNRCDYSFSLEFAKKSWD